MASEDEEEIPETEEVSDQGPKAGGALDRDKSPARGGGAIPLNPEDRAAPEGSAIDHLTVGQGNEMAAVLAGDERAFQQIQDGKEALRVTGEVLDAGVRTACPLVDGAEGIKEGNVLKAGLAAVSVLPGDEVLRGAVQAGKLVGKAKAGTEVVQRAMSRAELASIKNSGLLSRGGRKGDHFVSDAVNSNAIRARQRLSLNSTPEVRVTLEVPAGVFSSPSKVAPKYNMTGGGMERTAAGSVDIPARVLDVLEY